MHNIPRTLIYNIFNLHPKLVSHKSNNSENDESSKDASAAIPEGYHDGVPVHVVVELVVAGEGDHDAPGDTQGEEDLRAGVRPDSDVCQLLPLGREVEGDPVHVAGQRGRSHQQNQQDQVGEQGSHVHSLEKKRHQRYYAITWRGHGGH